LSDFGDIAAAIESICPAGDRPEVPFMNPAQGRRIYDHVRATGARDLLDIGTAHGASAAYMAASLDGGGRVTTVDRYHFAGPTPEETLERAGVADRVEVVRIEHSSYTWWLKDQVKACSDESGNCTPLFDFCYLDGAKDWNLDGLAVILIEKLLRLGGWLLLDDLDWSYDSSGYTPVPEELSAAERAEPHIRAVFEHIVKPHPSFTELRVEDDWWAWARKAPGEPRRLRLETTRGRRHALIERLPPRVRAVGRRLAGPLRS
jgi:predicted O-methyltransferase YrrM